MRNLPTVLARIKARRLVALPSLHPLLHERLMPLLEELGGRLTPWEGYRGMVEQAAARAAGFSNAAFGESPHNFLPSLAVDVVLHPSFVPVRPHPKDIEVPDLWDDETPEALAAWEALERAAENHGLARVTLKSGKRDRPHLELPGWRALIPH